ncbi:MAG: glutamine-hydrolyzing carbamoyl-phosphate synthase small subunit [Phycisphaeraceae bacterium]|nr:glutamine-hydrolyzing carbamoyl-phosphate synthase small subunit [Phycisphaeraceae bacterium]MCW5754982.1 glutamine-hydrolyzing carbamoyl-phosphate synthase small subunit [Phycisphaeraceae bacterium]
MTSIDTPSYRPARLVLEDGAIFRGRAFGARGITAIAELVFNTAMCGYQESLTDPSYQGQILVQTFPLIGNTGVNTEDVESARIQVSGFVIRELARRHSNYRASDDLDTYLAQNGVPAICEVDTRAITMRIRSRGAMRAIITDDPAPTDAELLARVRAAPRMDGQNLVPTVGCATTSTWSEDLGEWAPHDTHPNSTPYRVLAFDCGAKRNILRNLTERGCRVELIPHDTPASVILDRVRRGEIDGLFISNGPGDPAAVSATITTLRELLGPDSPVRLPTFGICLGHQLLALALGAKTYKLKFGHRGANQPVRQSDTGRVEITSQNHGFAVDPDSLEGIDAEATHWHLNDRTLAGFRLKSKPVFAVQYHPEASPGPHDSAYLFDEFVRQMEANRAVASAADS